MRVFLLPERLREFFSQTCGSFYKGPFVITWGFFEGKGRFVRGGGWCRETDLFLLFSCFFGWGLRVGRGGSVKAFFSFSS
jgi:hypothetical protein